jgi:ribosome-associated translation inhibitor RaiA
MSLSTTIECGRCRLNRSELERIRRRLASLERRLVHFAEPMATLVLDEHEQQRRVTADLRVELGHRAATLVSHQSAETADRAVKLAVEDIERQLERRLAHQRGQPTYGVPSRRLPKTLRPHPFPPDRGGLGR